MMHFTHALIVATVLLFVCDVAESAEPVEGQAPPAEMLTVEPDPLIAERDALREETKELRAKAASFRTRLIALRAKLRTSATSSRRWADIASEDEETQKLQVRLAELEKELQQVRETLKARMAENPEVKAQREGVAAVQAEMMLLRKEREGFERAGIDKMRRLKVVEAELAKREAAEAAEAAKAAGEAGHPASEDIAGQERQNDLD